jgi:hypothetical protein
MAEPEHDDPLHDSIALVEAVARDDPKGAGAILRNMDPGPVAVNLAKMLAEVLAEQEIPAEQFRRWAHYAARRP